MSAKRAMLRRQLMEEEKQKNAAPITKIQKARSEGQADGYKMGMDYATMATMRLCTTAMVAAAKEQYGLGRVRMMRFLDQYMETLKGFIQNPKHEEYLRNWIDKRLDICLDDITGVGVALDSRKKVVAPGLSDEEINAALNKQTIDTGEIGQAMLSAYDVKSVEGRKQL